MRFALLMLSLALLAPGAAQAAGRKLVVDSAAGPELFSGTLRSDEARLPRVPECRQAACDAYKLKIKLPRDTWERRSGGVQVAIRFIAGAPDDNLQLAIYRGAHRVGASTATAGTAQSVMIPAAKNGTYDVYVVDGVPAPSIAYEGLAQVNYDPVAKPRRDLLPDLVALPQQNVTLGPVPAGSSCDPSEIGAHVCLRFDQVLGNIGAGPLELRFDRQRIYRSDGSSRDVAITVGAFAQSRLWLSDRHGSRLGSAPVASGEQVAFCLAGTSINPDYWARRAFAADAYPAPGCLASKQGLAVGWTDEYSWSAPGQYVEVSGVPDGDYVLDTTIDPANELIESDTTNNCGSVRVRLSGMGTPNPQAQELGFGPSC
jgi:hypothetical protein